MALNKKSNRLFQIWQKLNRQVIYTEDKPAKQLFTEIQEVVNCVELDDSVYKDYKSKDNPANLVV